MSEWLRVNLCSSKARQSNKPESPLFYFHKKKKPLRWGSNPRPPAFEAVAAYEN